MNKRWSVVAVLVATALVCVLALARMGEDTEGQQLSPQPVAMNDRPDTPASDIGTDRTPPPLPASLRGTTEDGALVLDADGQFLPTTDALDLFDYYLSAIGEESAEQIRARIVAAIHARLDGDAALEAVALLDAYLVYRDRASAEFAGRLDGVNLERRLQYIRELRREVFGGVTAAALFGAEEDRWFVDLERRRLMLDASLDDDERDRRLSEIDDTLPESIREARAVVSAHQTLREHEARMKSEGAGAIEIDQHREDKFGRESATRLAALDASRLEWRQRMQTYRDQRDQLLEASNASNAATQIESLRAELFEDGELVRVRALDSIEDASL